MNLKNKKLKVFLFALLCSATLPSCKRFTSSAPKEEDSVPGRIQSYGPAHLTGIVILKPEKPLIPWSPSRLILSGLLPNELQSQVKEKMKWQSLDDSIFVVDKASGLAMARKGGTVTVKVKYLDFETSLNVESDPLSAALPLPEIKTKLLERNNDGIWNLELEKPQESIVKSIGILVAESSTATPLCSQWESVPFGTPEGTTLVENIELDVRVDELKYSALALKKEKSYKVVVCPLQVEYFNDEKLKVIRSGPATLVELAASLPPIPTPTPTPTE